MHKIQINRLHHMKCDICGKEETIEETDFRKFPPWWTRHWSEVTIKQFHTDPLPRDLNLCPTCTRKFRKIIMDVKLEDEYGPTVE